MEQVSQLMGEQRAEDALALLDKNLSDPEQAGLHGELFCSKIQILLTIRDNPAEAMAVYQDSISNHVELADQAYGVIESYLESRADHAGLIAWTEKTVASGLSEQRRADAYNRRINAFLSMSDTTNALLAVSQAVGALSDQSAVSAVGPVLESAFSKESAEMAESILDRLEPLAARAPEQKSFLTFSRLRLLGLKQEWDNMKKLFIAQLPGMDESEAARCYNMMASSLKKHKAQDSMESLQKILLDNQKPGSVLFVQVARQWVLDVCDAGDPAAVLKRVEAVMAKGLSGANLATFLRQPWYAVCLSGAENETRKMQQILEKILPEVQEESLRGSLLLLRLDGCFIREDMDGVITALKQGIPSKDEYWHKMALLKAEGHKAIKEGRKADAVVHFRKFMECAAGTDTAELDPETGYLVKTGWILAKNARRIGDLLAQDGKKAEALTAYQEATQAYKEVLGKYTEDSKEQKAIKKELASIPAAL
jgi:tetratricopeptide (TPR) repeat protein